MIYQDIIKRLLDVVLALLGLAVLSSVHIRASTIRAIQRLERWHWVYRDG